jgi:hypothetical protein
MNVLSFAAEDIECQNIRDQALWLRSPRFPQLLAIITRYHHQLLRVASPERKFQTNAPCSLDVSLHARCKPAENKASDQADCECDLGFEHTAEPTFYATHQPQRNDREICVTGSRKANSMPEALGRGCKGENPGANFINS